MTAPLIVKAAVPLCVKVVDKALTSKIKEKHELLLLIVYPVDKAPTLISAKVVLVVPEIVPVPFNNTSPVPGENVPPLFVQFPERVIK